MDETTETKLVQAITESLRGRPFYLSEMPGDYVGCCDYRGSQRAYQDYLLGKPARTGAATGCLRPIAPRSSIDDDIIPKNQSLCGTR